MQRKALDRLVTWVGPLLTAVLVIAGSLLTLLGLVHARRTPPAEDVFVFHNNLAPVAG